MVRSQDSRLVTTERLRTALHATASHEMGEAGRKRETLQVAIRRAMLTPSRHIYLIDQTLRTLQLSR